jgi:choline dehydrogenase-like flavoprotein
MSYDADVIVIGAGGGGPVAAKELGEKGLKVLVLEAGPWYGNRKWPLPNREAGAQGSASYGDLDGSLLHQQLNRQEDNMNDPVVGRMRWGPADRSREPWFRNSPQNGFIWQVAGVGGTTLHYLANCPRAYPVAVDGVWPIDYRELVPYYEKVESILPVLPAPMTAKEELFFYGAGKAGWPVLRTLNPTSPGYRPQPNAVLPPDDRLRDPHFRDFSDVRGCTLCGHCINGCSEPKNRPLDQMAKRSTNVSYVPLALKTGNVEIRPNTFTTKILSEKDPNEGLRAVGVQYRNTWTGETGELRAKVVILAAGTIESPRLWLNSGLPRNPWVGKGMTTHWFDWVTGIFDEASLVEAIQSAYVNPYVGQSSAARFDYPGVGGLELAGLSPGLFAFASYLFSQAGYQFMNAPENHVPWDTRGRIVGETLKRFMAEYRRSLSILILTDDEPSLQNGVTLDPVIRDEHGPVPVVQYYPTKKSSERRETMVKIAAEILRKAGAKHVHRSDWPPLLLHIQSTMRMGLVTDTTCEAFQVRRLFIADNSVLHNGLGGPNPTLTTQALATRTAEKILSRYF